MCDISTTQQQPDQVHHLYAFKKRKKLIKYTNKQYTSNTMHNTVVEVLLLFKLNPNEETIVIKRKINGRRRSKIWQNKSID